MKRYYIEEENDKEIKRTLITFANDDLTQLSDDELETLYYESSAQFLAKAMHFMKIENELFSRKNATVSDEILINAGNNIIEAINHVSNWSIKRRVIIFILTDDTTRSIALIQFAHKKADKGFNDIVAQLYEQEFKTQEKAKYEHIKQAKEKAIEEQRAEAEKQAEDDRIVREQLEAEREQEVVPNGNIGTDWSSVSPEQASEYLASKTGVSASKWIDVIYKESSGNPYVENPIGCYGLLQINQNSHGNVSGMTPQEYLDTAVNIYESQGGRAWQVW